jgi:hypothetical protein
MKLLSKYWKTDPGEESETPNRADLCHAVEYDRDGWRFVAIAMLIINVIWLVFGVLGYGLAAMAFR